MQVSHMFERHCPVRECGCPNMAKFVGGLVLDSSLFIQSHLVVALSQNDAVPGHCHDSSLGKHRFAAGVQHGTPWHRSSLLSPYSPESGL